MKPLATERQEEATVLVVEDHPQLSELLSRRLLMAGYQRAYVVRTAREALKWLHAGPVDVVVMDILLPHDDAFINGCEAGISIARLWPWTRLLFMSGLPLDALGDKCPEGIPFLAKPFALEEFLARIAETLMLPPWEPPEEGEWP